MRIGVIIPDRGDRPQLFDNCIRLLSQQTIIPCEISIINEPAKSEECDITYRYRIGYDQLRNKNLDVIAFIENDDYYAPDYLEYMIEQWSLNKRPELFGLSNTIYYHLFLRKHYMMKHHIRSSAMNTLIKPDMNFDWGQDNNPFTDIHLWNKINRRLVINPHKTICLGIKHGIGKCGAGMHVSNLERYKNDDSDLSFLKDNTDKKSFEFYESLINGRL